MKKVFIERLLIFLAQILVLCLAEWGALIISHIFFGASCWIELFTLGCFCGAAAVLAFKSWEKFEEEREELKSKEERKNGFFL